MPDDEKIIDAMARARCQTAGIDPDKSNLTVWTAEGEVTWRYAWHAEVEPAAKQLAAHRAMIKAESDAGLGVKAGSPEHEMMEMLHSNDRARLKSEKEQGD